MDAASFIAGILVNLVGAAILVFVYFSLDIYLALTRRDFGNVNIQVMYFTRNDCRSAPINDALHFRILGFKVPLRDIYRNRIMFWRVIYASLGAKIEQPVLNFGKYADTLLPPIRGQILATCAAAELRRVAGLPFHETKYQMVVVYDRSEDRKTYVLRVVLVREEDLKNFDRYLQKPPKVGKNFELLKRIVVAYREHTGSFLPIQIVTD